MILTFFQANELDFNTLFLTKKSFCQYPPNLTTTICQYPPILEYFDVPGAFSYKIKPQKTAFSDWKYQ